MNIKVCCSVLLLLYSSLLCAAETSVSIVDRPDHANERVYISDTPLGYGKTLYVSDRDMGRSKTFYFTANRNAADIVFKKPWESARAAALRLHIYSKNPGYTTVIYMPDTAPGYGTSVYFADADPGYGKSLYVEDLSLQERKKALAIMLMLLGEL